MKKKTSASFTKSKNNLDCDRGITRRKFIKKSSALVAGAAVGAVGFPYVVQSKTTKFLKPLVAGLNAKPGDPSYMSIELIPKILKEKYNIEMQIDLHQAMTLGTDWSQMEAVQHRFIDITSNVTSNFAVFTDAWGFCDLPYMFPTREKAWKFYKSDLFWEAASKVEKDMSVKVLPAVDAGGHRLLSNNQRELKTPDDVKGLKFRTVRSPIAADLINSWNGNPSPTAWAETYSAIQQNVIDGFHVQPIWTYVFSFYEVLKYMTRVRAIYSIQMQVLNINTFNAMPKNIQEAFMAAAQEAADIANKKDQTLEEDYIKKLQSKGMKLYDPSEEEFKKWYEAGRSIWKKHPMDPEILKKMDKLGA